MGFEGILVILFGHFWVSRVFWSFFRLRGYFGHFMDFGGILVIFWVVRGILVILGFQRYFGYFLGFEGISVILKDFKSSLFIFKF